MARPHTRKQLTLALSAGMRRRVRTVRVRTVRCTRPAFHYAVLCVWPVSHCA